MHEISNAHCQLQDENAQLTRTSAPLFRVTFTARTMRHRLRSCELAFNACVEAAKQYRSTNVRSTQECAGGVQSYTTVSPSPPADLYPEVRQRNQFEQRQKST